MSFPIEQLKADFLAASTPGCRILLSAPTGSGKSTRIPGMMLEAGWGERGTVLVVQPRRLAARMLATYTARQFPCTLGERVGYTVRFDSHVSNRTEILFVTDGILERRLTEDPQLRGVSAVIFDEIHERRLSGDLCLARTLALQENGREDLGVVVMSATLETELLASFMGPRCVLLKAEGKMYPVKVLYHPPHPVRNAHGAFVPPPVWDQCAQALKQVITRPDCGDVLVFMPGAYEIRKTEERLHSLPLLKEWDIFPLHGQLSPDAQNAAVEVGSRPRIIISTNIAETSLTIEGIRSVIDSGTARESRWDPRRGISTLHIVPISRAQAEQRKGRAGRLAPGICIRLWSESEHARRAAFPQPEIRRADLSTAFLNILAWGYEGLEGIRAFPWLESPDKAETERAWALLRNLGAVSESGKLSEIGWRMLSYPLSPVLSRLLIAGEDNECRAEVIAIAALMQGESVAMKTGLNKFLCHDDDFSDFQAEWRAVEKAHTLRYDVAACTKWGILARSAREITRISARLAEVKNFDELSTPDFVNARPRLIRALLQSFPDHVGIRNSASTLTARTVGNLSGVVSADGTAHRGEIFLAAEIVEIGAKNIETHFERCTLLSEESLNETGQLHHVEIPIYDRRKRRVLLRRQLLYRDLVLSDKECGDASPEQAAPLLAEQAVKGEFILNRWDGHVLQWIRRLNGLRNWMPELELPSFEEEDRLVALSMLCEGAVGYKDIADRPVLPILKEWLSPWQQQALNRCAPTEITLANGRTVKILYREDSTPYFSLKVQQLFGVRNTPRIAENRIPVQAEILAPNQRPWQITCDLASFWVNGYPQMKKDLAGRYPKHAWPDSAL